MFRLNLLRFTLAIAGGRLFRYLLEGYLAARYGEHAKELLARFYPLIGIGLALLIIALFVGRTFLRRGEPRTALSDVEN